MTALRAAWSCRECRRRTAAFESGELVLPTHSRRSPCATPDVRSQRSTATISPLLIPNSCHSFDGFVSKLLDRFGNGVDYGGAGEIGVRLADAIQELREKN